MPHDYASDTDSAVGAQFGDLDADRQRLDATCLSLYERNDGRLIADAASGLAVRTEGGRVWTFRIRSGFHFSPPSGERVDAGTFASTIERSTAPALPSSAATRALADLEGMHAYRRGLTSHIAGLQARGATLTIRLRHPVSDLDARLARPWFCAVPKDTPAIPTGLQDPIPSAGPYYVAAHSGGAWMVLRRNPGYPQPERNRFGAFVYHFDVEERHALDMIRRGQADYAAIYGHDVLSGQAASLRAVGNGSTIRGRISPRPGVDRAGRHRSRIAEFFGRRFGCRSYSPLYAGVDLERLCPVEGGG